MTNYSSHDDQTLSRINPATGYPMVGMGTGVDVSGNPYGSRSAHSMQAEQSGGLYVGYKQVSKRTMAIVLTSLFALQALVLGIAAATH